MIRPGLSRITALLSHLPQPTWSPIHVAGTNGKGSICAALDAGLRTCSIRTGRFTSPHLIDRWDCISIDNIPISSSTFLSAENDVSSINSKYAIDASPFELLTATAFSCFQREKVQVGIVECGMGGTFDATNVLRHPLACVIASISRDHTAWLGESIGEIAGHKAGIIKEGAGVIVDVEGENGDVVKDVVLQKARKMGSREVVQVGDVNDEDVERFGLQGMEVHQRRNLMIAYEALKVLDKDPRGILPGGFDTKRMITAMKAAKVSGRMQQLDLAPIVGKKCTALLDGAHNDAAWRTLSRKARTQSRPLVWILAASEGKDIKQMVDILVRPGDTVYAMEFGPVDGMPWVKAASSQAVAEECQRVVPDQVRDFGRDIKASIIEAAATSKDVCIAGSLYLVSDVLRLLREHGDKA